MPNNFAIPPSGAGGLTNINISAGTTSNNLSNLVFSNNASVSFGLDGSTITASVAAGGGGLTNIRVSAGTTSNLLSAITFADSNGVSFGINASTITATIATSLSNIRVSAGTTSNLLSAVTFSNSNGISFGINASTVTGSHNGITSQTNQQMTMFATGNTTQSSTGTTNASSIIFRGAGVASVGITDGSIVVSVPAGGGGLTNINVSAGTTSNNLSNIVFSNSNNVSFGLDGSTITATATVATSLTNIRVSAGTTSNLLSDITFADSNKISFGINASTITAAPPQFASTYRNIPNWNTAGTVIGNSSASVQPFIVPYPIVVSNFKAAASFNVATAANNSSAYVDLSITGVIYTRNASTLTSLTSFSNTMTVSWSSNASQTVTGMHEITATFPASTFDASEYFIALHISTTNTGTGANTTALGNSISMLIQGNFNTGAALVKGWNAQSAASRGYPGGQGILSTNATRASIGLSAYTQTGISIGLAPVVFELRNETWQ